MDIERIYQRLPIALQNLAVSVEGWRINQKRYGAAFERALREYRARELSTGEQLRAFRDARLRAFVARAARTVPHYREHFRRLRLHPEEVVGMEALATLPVLTKQEVRAEPARFMPDDLSSMKHTIAHTSGTTGAGLRFPVTEEAHAEQWAVWWRYRLTHGILLDEWCAYFGGRAVVNVAQDDGPFWRTNRPGRQVFFSGYHLGPETAEVYIAKLEEMRPRWLHGYPSMLALLAGYVLDAGKRLQGVRWVTTGAESLLPQQADLIREAFGVEPLQHYGMAEAVANISTCPLGTMHIDEDFAAVELVPGKDGSHRIVGTNLSNPAFPLLRYDAGDTATLDARNCACGRGGRVVARIDGRIEDSVVTRDGSRLGRLDHIFKDMISVKEAQLVQSRPGEVSVRIVRGAGYGPEQEAQLRRSLEKYFGERLRYAIDYVDSIEKTASGKLRFVVSRLA